MPTSARPGSPGGSNSKHLQDQQVRARSKTQAQTACPRGILAPLAASPGLTPWDVMTFAEGARVNTDKLKQGEKVRITPASEEARV